MRRLTGLCVVILALGARAADEPMPSTQTEARTLVYTDEHQILLGTPARELTPREFFQLLGRTDLLERSEAALQRRRALFISAAGVLVVGVAVGAYFLATTPDLSTGPCNISKTDTADYYNNVCVPDHRMHQVAGSGFIVGGVVAAGVLAGIGLAMNPDVLNHWEMGKLIDEQSGPKGTPTSLRLAPLVGPNLVGAVATGRF